MKTSFVSIKISLNMNSKLFYSITEVSEYVGIPPHVIRYWEKKFNLLKPEKDSRGRRRYTKKDLELVERIKRLIYEENYKLEGAKERIKNGKKSPKQDIDSLLPFLKKELESILEIVNK